MSAFDRIVRLWTCVVLTLIAGVMLAGYIQVFTRHRPVRIVGGVDIGQDITDTLRVQVAQ
jgi:hypothetical protein